MSDERYGRDRPRGDEYRRRDRDDDREYGSGQDYGTPRVYRPGRDAGGYDARGETVREDGPRYGWRDDGYQDYREQGRPGGRSYGGEQRFSGGYGRGDEDRQHRGGDQRRVHEGPQPGRHEGDRGFFDRASDEVRSWFGDEEAERRRERDAGDTGQGAHGNYGRDDHYHSWRNQQIATFDRDYDEYRRENQSRFHEEFSSWRSERQGQRDLLGRVREHMDVVGSDGAHLGTVDKVSDDRIILTKSDPDAGGHHHSIPSRWLRSAEDGRVVLTKTADEARQHWRDEEQSAAAGAGKTGQGAGDDERDDGPVNLNRSFPGTY